MKDFISQITNLLKKLTTAQKISIAAVLVIIVLTAGILIFAKSDVEYVLLFPNIDLNQSAEIGKKIEEFGFQYKIKNEKLYVPESLVDQIKMVLAQNQSLPNKSEGFNDVFKNQNYFGTTKAVERLNIVRGLQGELERTIMAIKGIKFTRVHIVIPEEKAFVEDQQPTTASVMITLEPLANIEKKQILGIVNLMAFAVEGLKPENVRIVDSIGRTLSDDITIEGTEGTFNNKRMEMQKNYESRLEKKVHSMLEQVVGYGKVVVRVVAELNFDQIERSSRNIEPPVTGEESGVPVSMQTRTETYEGDAPVPAGVPGTKTNVPNYKTEDKNKKNKYTKSDQVTNYDYNQKTEKLVIVPGDVKKLAISVFVDEDKNLSKVEKTEFIDSIKAAVGFDATRGDQISFLSRKFNRAFEEKQEAEFRSRQRAEKEKLILISAIVLFFLIGIPLFLKIINMVKQRKLQKVRTEEETRRLAARKKILEPILSVEEQQKKDKQDRIRQQAMENPEEVAQIIRSWINEED